nr:RNA-directed DNA polymerase, eukaryota, reverse transcriptase zinc-binding domain protein [Tanacetum cinerariifolium]
MLEGKLVLVGDDGIPLKPLNVDGQATVMDHFPCLSNTFGTPNASIKVATAESVLQVKERFENCVYGFFLGKRVAYTLVENYVKNTWSRFGLVPTMISSKGIFFFKFSSNTEDLKRVPVWVKLHDVPITAFTEDGMNATATKNGTSLISDTYTPSMCMESWDQSIFAKAMIDLRADVELKDTLVVVVPKTKGDDESLSRLIPLVVLVESRWRNIRRWECNRLLAIRAQEFFHQLKVDVFLDLARAFWEFKLETPRIERIKEVSVAAKWRASIFYESFRRQVRDGVESQQWSELLSLLGTFISSPSSDRWICDLNGDGMFRVKDIRSYLDDLFLPSSIEATRSVKYVPIKVNVFAWRARLDRLPTRDNLPKEELIWFQPYVRSVILSLKMFSTFSLDATWLNLSSKEFAVGGISIGLMFRRLSSGILGSLLFGCRRLASFLIIVAVQKKGLEGEERDVLIFGQRERVANGAVGRNNEAV